MYHSNDLFSDAKWQQTLLRYGQVRSQTKLHPLRKRPHWRGQNGEEQYLLELFQRIGAGSCSYVEFGAADGQWYSNTAYFRDQLGWTGLGFEGDREKVAALGPLAQQYNIHHEWVSSQNINALFQKHEVPADLSLLSVDIDGDDFWVWRALTVCQPRVVIIETNPSLPNDVPLTIVEGQTGCRPGEWENYFGANLRAMVRLGKQKGYELACCVSFNAIFVREDLFHLTGCPRLSEDQAVLQHFHPRHYWYQHRDTKNRVWLNPFA